MSTSQPPEEPMDSGIEEPRVEAAEQPSPEPASDGAALADAPPPNAAAGAVPPPPPPPPGPAFGLTPPPPQTTGSPAQPPQPGVHYNVPQDQKNLALISTLGIIIVGFLSPLIVYLLTSGDPSKRFANDHAKEGLNFSIVYFVAWAVAFLLAFVIIGFLLMPVLIGWGLWVIIAGAMQASNGEAPHYPLVPKILK